MAGKKRNRAESEVDKKVDEKAKKRNRAESEVDEKGNKTSGDAK